MSIYWGERRLSRVTFIRGDEEHFDALFYKAARERGGRGGLLNLALFRLVSSRVKSLCCFTETPIFFIRTAYVSGRSLRLQIPF